jgi:hypothetical protein
MLKSSKMFKDLPLSDREKEDIKRYMEDYLHTKDEEYAIHQLLELALEVYRYKSCKDLLKASEHILNHYSKNSASHNPRV